MNSEDIYDGITDIRDDQINGAEKSPKGRKPRLAGWFVAAAAMLAVVVTSAALFKPDGKLPVKTETEPVGTTAAEETEASTLPIITSAHGDETAYGMFDTEGSPAATELPAAAPEQTTTNLPTTRDPETEQDICGYPTEPPATTKAPEATAAQTTSPKTTLPIEHIAARQLASVVKPEQAQQPTYPEYPQDGSDEDYQAYKAAVDEYNELENIWYEQFRSRRELSSEYNGTLDGFNGAVAEQLLSGAGNENRVCSPTSLYLALSMLAETTDGTSRGQILELLGCESIEEVRTRAEAVWESNYIDDGRDKTLLANSLWLSSAYLGSYNAETVKTLAEVYYADSFCGTMGDEDYNEMLRKWINDNTGGRLEEQANGLEFPQDTVLGLASTVYFKGRWNEPFVEGNTAPDVFHAEGGDITVDFMHQRIDDAAYYRGEGFSAIEKSMHGSSSMKIILPDEGVSVDELLASGQMSDFLAPFSDYSRYWENRSLADINLSLPKFDVASDIDLTDSLKALGVTDVLDKEKSDFSPMFTEGNAYLAEAKHAARVTVDEEGVEAAAYTVMLANPTSQGGADIVVDFIADRPFIFAITGEGGALLFAGVVNNPAE